MTTEANQEPKQRPAPTDVLCLLEALLPGVENSKVTSAVRDLPPEIPLPDAVCLAASTLGLEFHRVELPAEQLATAGLALPVLEMSPRPCVVLSASPRSQRIREPSGRTFTRPISGSAGEARSYWFVSSTQQLKAIAQQHGVARLRSYLKLEAPLIRYVILFAIGVEVLSLAVPLTVQVLINTIGFGMLVQPLVILSAILLLCLSGAAGFRILQMFAVEHLVRRFMQRVASDFGTRLGRLAEGPQVPSHPDHRYFEVASVDKAFFVLGLDLVALVLQIAAATVLLSVYHPILLGFALALATAAWLAIRVPFSAALRRSFAESSAKYALAEWLATHPRGDQLQGREHLSRWTEARKLTFRLAILQQAALFVVQVVFSAGLLLLGGRLVIAGQLTLGQLVAAELVTTTALVSLGKVGKQLPKVYDLLTSIEKLGRIVDLPLRRGPLGGRMEDAA